MRFLSGGGVAMRGTMPTKVSDEGESRVGKDGGRGVMVEITMVQQRAVA